MQSLADSSGNVVRSRRTAGGRDRTSCSSLLPKPAGYFCLSTWYAAHAFEAIPEEAPLTACLTKAHISDVGTFVAKTSTEVHGGMGFTDEQGLHYWFKRIGANRQLLGGPELVREEAARLQGLVA